MSTRAHKQDKDGATDFTQQSGEEAAKIERIAGHTAGLVEDLKSWFELKLEFVMLDVKEEIKAATTPYVTQAVSLAIVLLAALFGLTAAAYGLGEWLGHSAWGFLVVAVTLLVVAIIVKMIGGRASNSKHKKKTYTYDATNKQAQLPASVKKGTDENGQKLVLEAAEAHKTPGNTTQDHGKNK